MKERKHDFNRLRKVLLRESEPDVVPFYELFADNEIVSAVTGKAVTEESLVEFFYKLGYDYVTVWPWISYATKSNKVEDKLRLSGTREFADENNGTIENRHDFNSYNWPDVNEESTACIDVFAPMLPYGMKMILTTRGVFESVMFLMGLVPFSYALSEDEQLIYDMFETVGAKQYKLLKTCFEKHDLKKIGAVALCEDMGFVQATFLPPEIMRKYAFPWMKKYVDLSHQYDLPVIVHACGNLEKVMDDLIDYVGFDAKHSFENKILPITEAKARYGNRIALMGGVDINFLSTSSEEQVKEYVESMLPICMKGGGYALGTGNSVANYIPLENYLAMLDVGKEIGIYR